MSSSSPDLLRGSEGPCKRILAVGVATLDILNTVPEYPREDEELRVLEQKLMRGGNATNTMVVLSQLGHACSWAGTLADGPDSQFIRKDLARYLIDTTAVRCYAGAKTPTSYVILSQATGSRSIIHHRDLPEYQAEDFAQVDTRHFDWVHFEGRNPPETEQMLQQLKQDDPGRLISLELEKPREGIDRLYGFPDVLLFSKTFALALGHTQPQDLFASMRMKNHQAWLFCAWGEQGAWLQTPKGGVLHQPAFVPSKVVDTLGAGDVFNAGVIHGMLQGVSAQAVLQGAVELAGRKCGQLGLERIIHV